MTIEGFQECARCVLNTRDAREILFDATGVCNHCNNYEKLFKTGLKTPVELKAKVDEIKVCGKGKKYDCLIGVSGGVDSTFVALKIKELGLIILVFEPLHFQCRVV